MFVWWLWNISPRKTSISTIAADSRNFLKPDPTTYAFLKIFNNFQSNCSTKQRQTIVSCFPQKNWWYLMKHTFAEQKTREPTLNYLLYMSCSSKLWRWAISFLSNRSVVDFLLWKVSKAKINHTRFFVINSNFYLSLRLLKMILTSVSKLLGSC